MTQTSNDAQRGIDRREALRRAALVLGGALSTSTIAGVLAGCEERRTPDGAWTPRALTVDQLDLVATIAEHILPETDSPGARAVGVHRFIDAMLADSSPDEERRRFLAGLADVDARPPRGARQGLRHRVVAALAVRPPRPGRRAAVRARLPDPEQELRLWRGDAALLRERSRAPVRHSRRQAVPLDPRLSARRAQPDLGPGVLAVERPRFHRQPARRPRRRLADPAQGSGAMGRLRRPALGRER